MTQTLTIDPFTAIAGDRHAAYAALAATGPVHRFVTPSGAPAWLVTGHDEVRRALADRRVVKGPPLHGPLAELLPPEVAAVQRHMLYRNPPDHGRLRRLVSAAFTRRRVDELAPRVHRIADELLDGLAGRVEVDLIGGFAYPLPMTVICELLGRPGARSGRPSGSGPPRSSPARSPARRATSPRPPRWPATSGRWSRASAGPRPTTCISALVGPGTTATG